MAEGKSEEEREGDESVENLRRALVVPPPNNTLLQHDVERINDDGRCVDDTIVNDTEAPDGDETAMSDDGMMDLPIANRRIPRNKTR